MFKQLLRPLRDGGMRTRCKRETVFGGSGHRPEFVSDGLSAFGGKGDSDDSVRFNMVVSAGAKTCLPNASATVRISPAGSVEIMDVSAGIGSQHGVRFLSLSRSRRLRSVSLGIRATSRPTRMGGAVNNSLGDSVLRRSQWHRARRRHPRFSMDLSRMPA